MEGPRRLKHIPESSSSLSSSSAALGHPAEPVSKDTLPLFIVRFINANLDISYAYS